MSLILSRNYSMAFVTESWLRNSIVDGHIQARNQDFFLWGAKSIKHEMWGHRFICSPTNSYLYFQAVIK